MNPSSLHVDHVGSLLRPAALREKRLSLLGVHDADHNLGAHANAELTKIEDGYIREVVKLQEAWGLPVVTDGDFRRRSWWTDFLLSFTGLSISYDGKTPITLINAAGEKRPIAGIKVEDKIRPRDSGLAASFKFLKSIADRTAKVTIPGPPIFHFLRDAEFVPSVYPDIDAFWHDLIAAYRSEIKKLADAGCRYLQIDECMLPYLCDPRHREMSKSRGDDPDQLIETYTWAINEIVAAKPKDMMVAVHMCRGNMNAFWGGDGGYEPVTGGADGLYGFHPAPLFGVFPFELDGSTAYWYAAIVLLLVFAVCKVVVNSPFGLTIRGVRENPVRMRLLGVPVLRRLVMMYIISGFLAGIAGGLSAQVTQLVALDSFSFILSGNVLIMLVLGGTGSLNGAILGAALFVVVSDRAAAVSPFHWLFALGIGLILMVRFAPSGLISLFAHRGRRYPIGKDRSGRTRHQCAAVSRAAAVRLGPGTAGTRNLSVADGLRKHGRRATRRAMDYRTRLRSFSEARRAPQKLWQSAIRRRATDAGDWACACGQSEGAFARRTFRGSRASFGRQSHGRAEAHSCRRRNGDDFSRAACRAYFGPDAGRDGPRPRPGTVARRQ